MSVYNLRMSLEPQLLQVPGVTGVGNLDDRIRLYVEGTPDIFPTHVNNVKLEVVKTGKLHPLELMNVPWFLPKKAMSLERTGRLRPILGGYSCGHPLITAGTLGCAIKLGGVKYGLSNNHVLAAASSSQNPRASIGDPIYQPGVYDGGTEADTVGTLYWYKPFDEKGVNVIDAALFKPASQDLLSEEILDIGLVNGIGVAAEGSNVQKSGRTTGVTVSDVLDVNATVKVDYGIFGLTLSGQIITNYMADGGDSGSALLDMDKNLVGLLFAGSSYVTVHNNIAPIIQAISGAVPGAPGAPAAPATTPYPFILPPIVGSLIGGFIR